jgi:hypothetical protein
MHNVRASLYIDGKLEELPISKYTKPLILVGSGVDRYAYNTAIGENIAHTLQTHRIDFARYKGAWPKDDWIYHKGNYVSMQASTIGDHRLGEGGMHVLGYDFVIGSTGVIASSKAAPQYIEEMKQALGVSSVHLLEFLGHKHIDLRIGHIPWKGLFVVDKEYFMKRSLDIETIVDHENGDIVLTEEIMAPNFLVYDYPEACPDDRFVLTYAAPRLSKNLRARGVNVIEAMDAKTDDLRYKGGASCTTNMIASPSLLPRILRDSGPDMQRVYMSNPNLSAQPTSFLIRAD